MDSDALMAVPRGPAMNFVLAFVPRRLRPLIMQLREDWKSHYSDWTLPGFRGVAVHRVGAWVEQESGRGLMRGPIRIVLRRLHLMMYRYVRNQYGIELPHTVVLGRRVVLGHQSGIVIHPYATIGDDCVIRQNVTIGALNAERVDGSASHRAGRGVGRRRRHTWARHDWRRFADWTALRRHDRRPSGIHGLRQPTSHD